MADKFAVKPIDWASVGLTEKEVHDLLYGDEEMDVNPKLSSANLGNEQETKRKCYTGKIDWSDIGMTEEEVHELLYSEEDDCHECKTKPCEEYLLIDQSTKCGINNLTSEAEATMCSTIENSKKKQDSKSSSNVSADSKVKVLDEYTPILCKRQTEKASSKCLEDTNPNLTTQSDVSSNNYSMAKMISTSIGNGGKRKFHETTIESTYFDISSPCKERRLETIEDSTISDTVYEKSSKRKGIIQRLGSGYTNNTTKVDHAKAKRRPWR